MTPPAGTHAARREEDEVKLSLFGQSLTLSGKVAKMAWPWVAVSIGGGALAFALLGAPAQIKDEVKAVSTKVDSLDKRMERIEDILIRRGRR
jgi:hypothetical protein